jgi:hypothetical protein
LLAAEKNLGDATRALEALRLVANSDKAEKERLQKIDVSVEREREERGETQGTTTN